MIKDMKTFFPSAFRLREDIFNAMAKLPKHLAQADTLAGRADEEGDAPNTKCVRDIFDDVETATASAQMSLDSIVEGGNVIDCPDFNDVKARYEKAIEKLDDAFVELRPQVEAFMNSKMIAFPIGKRDRGYDLYKIAYDDNVVITGSPFIQLIRLFNAGQVVVESLERTALIFAATSNRKPGSAAAEFFEEELSLVELVSDLAMTIKNDLAALKAGCEV